jgi:hypothetical protein
MQKKLAKLLVDVGLVSSAALDMARDTSAKTKKPLMAVLTEGKVVDDEMLVHAIAQISGVPYVNLMTSIIDQKILGLLQKIQRSVLWPYL